MTKNLIKKKGKPFKYWVSAEKELIEKIKIRQIYVNGIQSISVMI